MRFLLFVIIILFIIPASLSNVESKLSENNFTQGNRFYQEEKYEEAISHYESILNDYPNSTKVIGKTGDSFFQLKNFEKAIEYYLQVIKFNPTEIDDSGKLYIDKLLELEPKNVEALYTKGKSLAFFNNTLDEANSYFDSVLEIDTRHTDALSQKGNIYFQLDQFEKSISFFDKVLEIEPNHVDALSSKGYALAKLGKFDESNSYLEQALQISPNSADALYRKGSSLLVQGKSNDAFSFFYNALKNDPRHIPSQIKLDIIADSLPVYELDGYAEAKVYDVNGYLVGHLKANHVFALNHTTIDSMMEEWPITKIIERNGKEYEVHQNEQTIYAPIRYVYGGGQFYGVYIPPHVREQVTLIFVNYWMFEVDPGDSIKLTQTVFRQAA